jgi:hypothetical protein
MMVRTIAAPLSSWQWGGIPVPPFFFSPFTRGTPNETKGLLTYEKNTFRRFFQRDNRRGGIPG